MAANKYNSSKSIAKAGNNDQADYDCQRDPTQPRFNHVLDDTYVTIQTQGQYFTIARGEAPQHLEFDGGLNTLPLKPECMNCCGFIPGYQR